MRLYTVHHKGSGDIRVVADRFDGFALAALVVFYGLAVIAGFEGGAVRRAELRLRRWREAGVVEARSPEGAEELYLRGEAA